MLLAMVMVISCGNDKKSNKEENATSEKVETEKGEEEADADADPAPDLSKTVNRSTKQSRGFSNCKWGGSVHHN